MICGSSSRGVSTTARTPSISEARTMRGVSLLRRKPLANRPARPRLGSLAMAHPAGDIDGLAILERAGVIDDLLAVLQAGPHGQEAPLPFTQGKPAELGVAVLGDEHAGELTALDQGGAGHGEALDLGNRGHQDPRERTLTQALGLEHL